MIKRLISHLSTASLPTRLAWMVLINCLAVSCLLALLCSVLMAHFSRDRLLNQWRKEVQRFSAVIAEPLSTYQFRHVDNLTRVFVHSQPLTLSVSIWYKSGLRITSQSAKPAESLDTARVVVSKQALLSADGSETVGEIELQRRPISRLQIVLDYAPTLLVGILAASFLLAWVIQRHIHRRLAQPLQQLSERVSNYSLLDEGLDPSTEGGREIAQLSSTLHKMASQLRQHALYDTLTGLPNRLYLTELIEKAKLSPHRHYALLLMDLDHFKSINDNFGHDVGDSLLLAVADRVKACLPKSAHFVRMGGDEFVIFCDREMPDSDPQVLADLVLQAFAQPFMLSNGAEVQQHTSGGIALTPEDGLSLDELLTAADLALYHTKELRTAAFSRYQASMKGDAKTWFDIAAALRALPENQDCLFNFQPIARIDSGRIWGYEMLLRLRDAKGQPFNPEKVVQVAEQINLLPAITERTFGTALSFLKSADTNINLTINLSPTQLLLLNPGGTEQLSLPIPSSLRSRLTIELTEQSLLDRKDVIRAAKTIQKLGYRFALDDFGSGYSALNCLNTLPIYMLKLDKSLAKNLHKPSKPHTLFYSIIQVAKNLDLMILVEGIETGLQLNLAQEQRCDFAQGYLIGHPRTLATSLHSYKVKPI